MSSLAFGGARTLVRLRECPRSLLSSAAVAKLVGTRFVATSATLQQEATAAPAQSAQHAIPPNLFLDRKTRSMVHDVQRPILPASPPVASDVDVPVVSFLSATPTGSTVTLDARIFGTPLRRDIVHRVIVWQNKKARTTTYKTKTRAEVRGGGRKPWKQKGTGRARQGSIRSPIWTGGGQAHGPQLRDWSIDLPKRVRRFGLRVALSAKLRDQRLLVVDSLAMTAPEAAEAAAAVAASGDASSTALAPIVAGKTRALERLLAAHGLTGKRALFIDGDHPPVDFGRAVRNLQRMKPLPARGANVADIVNAETLVVTPAALDAMQVHLLQDF